jgi:hypothetical protein
MQGEPMAREIRAWPELEKRLTVRVLAPYIKAIEDKREIAAVMKVF